jgi:uncharacterized protein with NAD-binding domain and iron-sulfur cluster
VAVKLLEDMEKWAKLLPGDGSSTVTWLLEQFKEWLLKIVEKEMDKDDNLRRLWIMLDLASTTVIGLIADDVREKGFASINNLDYIEWITKHGADQRYTVPFVRHNLYDQAFAFEGGDDRYPNFAAGIVTYTAMRTYFTYKGAFLWKMQAGMGDTIFGPIYEVLKKRGVTFKFFHEVENLQVSGDTISKISIGVQATVKPEVAAAGGYRPFVNIKGLPCWPSEPCYDQLVEGEILQQDKIDLESFWTPWQNVDQIELEAGRDYDLIVFGISLGAVPFVCSELITAKSSWATMVQKVKTIQTQAFQLWLKPDDAGLGWPMWRRQSATLTGYDADNNPGQAGLDTWGDFTHLLTRECWPDDNFPNNIAYVCGAMKAVDVLDLPPRSDTEYPAREQAKVVHNSKFFLNNYINHLWPEATQAANPQALDWDLVVSDFYRVNIDPSERYVLSVADSVQYRIKPDKSGFGNLHPAGDWTYNGLLSVGCVESAVIGGMQAANAVLTQFGYAPVEIIGWAE